MEKHPIPAVDETSFLQADKLFAAFLDCYRDSHLGALIKGIVHNLNGSLQILGMQMEMLQRMLEREKNISPPIHQKAAECIDQIDHFRSMIEILMSKALDDEEELPQKIHLNELLEEDLATEKHNLFFKHQVQVQKALSPTLPLLKGYRRDFSQGLWNLIQNAIEAMGESSRQELTIATNARGDSVEVMIKDTGCGVSEKMQPHLFQPFFTTKGGRHHGLGLYISRKLLTPYGAFFRYTSQKEETIFRIIFPIPKSGPWPD